MLFERGELRLDGAGRLARTIGEGLGHRAALNGDETIHLLEAAADGLGKGADVAGDAIGKLAATAHDVLESGEARAQGLLHVARAGIHGGRQGVGCAVEHFVDACSLRGDGEDDVLARACETDLRIVRMAGEGSRRIPAPRVSIGGLELVDLRAHEEGDALADLGEGGLQGLALHA